MNQTILIIEDDVDILEFLDESLTIHQFQTITSSTGNDALNLLREHKIDLVLLDVELPDTNGFELCRKIREVSTIPIIFVSCRDDGADIIQGLELGGDDYVTKPFDLFQLIARIKSNLRRIPILQELPKVENVEINFALQRLFINKEEVSLSSKEFQLFAVLFSNPSEVFSPSDLYSLVWGADSLGDIRTLKVHISRLRKKLEQHPNSNLTIQTVRGKGYSLTI